MRPIPAADAIQAYILDHNGPVDGADREIGRDQGTFLTLLTQLMTAEHAIEIGMGTGYTALCIARGLPAGGRLITCDVSGERSELAEQEWLREGLTGRIDPRPGPAIETLRGLPAEPAYDLAFLGADKPGYLDCYEELVPRLRPGGVIVIDDVLLAGTVVTDPDDEAARTMREFNAHICADKRVDAVMLSIGDGVTLARKRIVDDAA